MQEIGFARGEKLCHFFTGHLALQNDFTRTKVAGAICAHGFLTDVSHARVINIGLTLWTFADRFLPGKIYFLGLPVVAAASGPEIEFRLVLRRELDHRREGPSH